MLSVYVQLVKGDSLILVEFATMKEMREELPQFYREGWKDFYKGLRDDVSVKVTDTIMDKLEIQDTNGNHVCPRHPKGRVWDDKKTAGKKFCAEKIGNEWCGYGWEKDGTPYDRRARQGKIDF